VLADIARFVEAPRPGAFEALALRAFAFQFERVEPYRRWCERVGRTPATAGDWREVPWVPAQAMKSIALHAEPAVVTFRSSGTTAGERRSEHHHPYPELYRRVIECSFPEFCLPRDAGRTFGSSPRSGGEDAARTPMLSLVPPFEPARESSLSFMIDHVLARFGATDSANVVGAGGIDFAAAISWLSAHEHGDRAVLVLTTALALDQALREFERLELRLGLPRGSLLFVTGGFKTRHAELTLADLLARAEERLAIAPGSVVQEYGMTELTSQAYTRTPAPSSAPNSPDLFVCPPWMRVRAIDPRTLEPSPPGAAGLLAIFDLANVGSVLHLLTEDLAIVEDGGFQLLGRASGAELRGCSLTAEELAAHAPAARAPNAAAGRA
jgi:hypothetical protein